MPQLSDESLLNDANGLPVALGQGTKAASLPVTLASDQGNLPVSQATASALNATVVQGAGSGAAATFWYSRITDGTNTMPTMDAVARKGFVGVTDGTNGPATVKAASTAVAATDLPIAVGLHPTSPLPAGTNAIGTVAQGTAAAVAGGWPVKVTDGTNIQPTMDAVARKAFVAITDGTNGPATVKPASTAAVATDLPQVVALHPSSPLPAGTNTIGAANIGGYSYSSYSPDPSSIPTSNQTPLDVDASGRLEVHATTTSDEGSFREDFGNVGGLAYVGTTITANLTGTVNFQNGATIVTGTGTAFTTQIVVGQYIKKSTDPEADYVRVNTVNSDTQVQVDTAYLGTTASVAGVVSDWLTSTAATGGSITQATSVVSLVSGTASGQNTYIQRAADYGPFTLQVYATISQRIANQTAMIGFRDNWATPLGRAEVQFTGTVNTQVNFVTSQDGTLQTTTVTLPNGGTTATQHLYKIDISGNQCTLSIDGVPLAKQTLHIPAPYQVLNIYAGTTNSATVTATTLSVDAYYFYNTDRIQIDDDFGGEPLPVTLITDANFRQRVSIVYQAAATATADTLLSLVKSTNGTAATGATSIAPATGKNLRITSMTFSVKANAATAAFATFTLRINPAGAAVIGSQSEFRVDLGNTEATVGAARAITIPIPDGLELNGAAQLAVSAAAQATTNILSVALNGYEYSS